MAVVDSKEGTSWPVLGLLKLGLDDVEDDADSVFVVVPDDPLVGVSSVRNYHSVSLTCELGRLIVLYELNRWVIFHCLSLTHCRCLMRGCSFMSKC